MEENSKMFNSNRNDTDLITNELNISTNKIRIFPSRWNKNPSLKIYIQLVLFNSFQMSIYKRKMLSVYENDQVNYYKLYADNCLNVKNIHLIKLLMSKQYKTIVIIIAKLTYWKRNS